MIEKLPLVPLVLAAFSTALYMFFEKEWQLEADAVAIFLVLALVFSVVQWRVNRRRGGTPLPQSDATGPV